MFHNAKDLHKTKSCTTRRILGIIRLELRGDDCDPNRGVVCLECTVNGVQFGTHAHQMRREKRSKEGCGKSCCSNRTVHTAGNEHRMTQQATKWDLAPLFRVASHVASSVHGASNTLVFFKSPHNSRFLLLYCLHNA